MIQSGGILGELLVAISQTMFQAQKETLKKDISLAPRLAKKQQNIISIMQ